MCIVSCVESDEIEEGSDLYEEKEDEKEEDLVDTKFIIIYLLLQLIL